MELKDFIKIYDNVVPEKIFLNFFKFANQGEYKPAGVSIGNKQVINTNERNVSGFDINNNTPSLTEAHWYNFICSLFGGLIEKYKQDTNVIMNVDTIQTIEILKYEVGGFYKYHTDHCSGFPRTISGVYLLNDNYKGGELCFRNADTKEEQKIEVKTNRFILWPSNFLYPHTVMPVTEGTRYSLVCWAL